MSEIKTERSSGSDIGNITKQWSRLPKHWYSKVADNPDSVLLETARFDASNQRSFLFSHPTAVLSASTLDQIPELFQRIEEALADGFYVAGFVGYESGYHFQSVDAGNLSPFELPLAWFGVYKDPLIFDHQKRHEDNNEEFPVTEKFNDGREFFPDQVHLTLSEEKYREKILRIQDYIRAGDTYQVNFTDSVEFRTPASAMDAFTTLSRRQPVSYSAFLNVAGHHVLSLSPELFFRIEDGRITTRPMKGTMPRGLDSAEDLDVAVRLQNDEKNRAEHVMIVDLLRNDLGRICTAGSVTVEDIFSVEKYKTLFQMTSTVSGTLIPGISYYDIFKSMFPGGSITGAPKIRTMQIIRELERSPRGIYSGAIGFIAPDRSSAFNIAIRTLVMREGKVRMGIGGGIVADSSPAAEYQECLLKANFLVRPQPKFQLLETMLWDDEFTFLAMHLDRLESSAAYFEFAFDRDEINSRLLKLSNGFLSGKPQRVRLLLDSNGEITITAKEYLPQNQTGLVRLASERTFSKDVFLRHKTTHRERYDRLYAEARADGFDEVIFLNENGEVTEGAISNLFVRHNGKMLTPPLRCGVLPGVFRRHLLETDTTAEEKVLTLEDMESADAVFLCNSVRGMRQVILRR